MWSLWERLKIPFGPAVALGCPVGPQGLPKIITKMGKRLASRFPNLVIICQVGFEGRNARHQLAIGARLASQFPIQVNAGHHFATPYPCSRSPGLRPGLAYNTKRQLAVNGNLRSHLKLPFNIIKAKLGSDLRVYKHR